MARSVKQETGRVPRCPGDAGGAPDAWPGTATNGSWRNRARPAGRRPPRAWRPRPAAGSTSRRARPTTRDARGRATADRRRCANGPRNGRGNRPEPAWPIARRSTAAGRRSRRAPRTPCAGPAPCPGARPAWRRARRCRCDPRRWWAPCPARRRSWPARPPACPARSGRAAASANLARPSRRRPAPMRLWTSIRPWERQGGAVHPKAARPGRG